MGKNTIARVYPGMSGQHPVWLGPEMVMYISRDGFIEDGPIDPINAGTVLTFREDFSQNPTLRALRGMAYEFQVPGNQRHGTIMLMFTINEDNNPQETNDSNNFGAKLITFQPQQGIKMVMVPVTMNGQAPTQAEMTASLSYLQRIYPVNFVTTRWNPGVNRGAWNSANMLNQIENLRTSSANFQDHIWCAMLTYRSGATPNTGWANGIPAFSLYAHVDFAAADQQPGWAGNIPWNNGNLSNTSKWHQYLDLILPHENRSLYRKIPYFNSCR